MKILQINKHHFLLGGAEKYYLSLSELLKENDNKVAFFSVIDKRNLDTPWSKYFVKTFSFGKVSLKNYFRSFQEMIFPSELKEKFGALLDNFRPDIIHIHNFYNHMIPAMEAEILKRKIPVVRTLHDYSLISPNVTLSHGGKECLHSKDGLIAVIRNKCVNDSYVASFFAGSMFYIQKVVDEKNDFPDSYIAPSLFMKKKCVEFGVNSKKIKFLNNFSDYISPEFIKPKRTYFLFVGRLLKHKGADLLLETARMLPEFSFKIAGSGPEEKSLRKYAKKKRLKNVEFLGWLDTIRLRTVILNSYASILPSVWPENSPYSLIDTFSMGRTVMASRIGGIREIVKDGQNGILFNWENKADMAEKIRFLWNHPSFVGLLSRNARHFSKEKFDKEVHYRKITTIYKRIVAGKK